MIGENIKEMEDGAAFDLTWLRKEVRLLEGAFKILFYRAPCMMHMVNEDGRIVKVNQRWLEAMGYEKEEVVGCHCFDFLTKESHERAVSETLPLFWQVGSARSVGYQFVAKDHRRIPVLMDAEVFTNLEGNRSGVAAIYPNEDFSQWNEARKTLEGVSEILGVQTKLQTLLSNRSCQSETLVLANEVHSNETLPTEPLTNQFIAQLLERADDISVSLRGILRTQEERLDLATEQGQELLLEVRNLGGTLRELVDVVAVGVEAESLDAAG